MKRKIRLTEEDLHRIVKKSVNTVLNEEKMSQEYKDAMEGVVEKMVANLEFNEQSFLYDIVNDMPWEFIYSLLSKLQHNDYQ